MILPCADGICLQTTKSKLFEVALNGMEIVQGTLRI